MAKAVVKAKVKSKAASAAKSEKIAKKGDGYGVNDLARVMGIKPASVRIKLRKSDIEWSGRGYHFATMAEVNEVAKSLTK